MRKLRVGVDQSQPGATEAKIERALDAFELRKQGLTLRQIAERFGKSVSTIHDDIELIREGMRAQATVLAEQERDVMVGQCRQIISKFAPIVLTGDVAIMLDRDGKPVLSADRIEAVSKAALVIMKAHERISKFMGLDAPERVISENTNRFVNDEELAQRDAEQSPLVAAMGSKIDRYRQRPALLALLDASETAA